MKFDRVDRMAFFGLCILFAGFVLLAVTGQL